MFPNEFKKKIKPQKYESISLSIRRYTRKSLIVFSMILTVLGIVLDCLNAFVTFKKDARHQVRFAIQMIGEERLEAKFKETRKFYEEVGRNTSTEDEYKESYLNPLKAALFDEEYIKMRQILVECRQTGEFSNLSIFFYDKEKDRAVFVIDGDVESWMYYPGQWVSNEIGGDVNTPEMMDTISSSSWLLDFSGVSKLYGIVAGDYIHIKARDGSFLGYAYIESDLPSFLNIIASFIVFFIPFVLALVSLFVYLTEKRINQTLIIPLVSLSKATLAYSEADKTVIYSETGKESWIFEPLEMYTRNEIEDLWRTLDNMEKNILSQMRQIEEDSAESERIGTELFLASQIQSDMLPRVFNPLPEYAEMFSIYASMKAARKVGGDFYDFFPIDSDRLAILIADVSGKGVPGALYMSMCKILTASHTTARTSPKEVLYKVNNAICTNNEENMFLTVWLGFVSVLTGEVIAANAGHENPILRDKEGNFNIIEDTHSFVVGAFEDTEYEDYTFHIEKGGAIFLYTDGIVESMNEQGGMFGVEKLVDVLNGTDAHENPEQIIKIVNEKLDCFKGNAEQFDDETMLCFSLL